MFYSVQRENAPVCRVQNRVEKIHATDLHPTPTRANTKKKTPVIRGCRMKLLLCHPHFRQVTFLSPAPVKHFLVYLQNNMNHFNSCSCSRVCPLGQLKRGSILQPARRAELCPRIVLTPWTDHMGLSWLGDIVDPVSTAARWAGISMTMTVLNHLHLAKSLQLFKNWTSLPRRTHLTPWN